MPIVTSAWTNVSAFAILGLVAIMTSSCGGYVGRIPLVARTNYPVADKLPLHAYLVLKPQYTSYEFIQIRGIESYRIGEGLRANAENVARAAFETVTVAETAPLTTERADVVVIPSVVTVQRTLPVSAFGETHNLMEIEWRVEDLAGHLIWLGTSRGEAGGKLGTPFNADRLRQEQIQATSTATFLAAYEDLVGSPELRSYATKVRKTSTAP